LRGQAQFHARNSTYVELRCQHGSEQELISPAED
jgi:hypothetical protein